MQERRSREVELNEERTRYELRSSVLVPPTFAFDAKTISRSGIFRNLPTVNEKLKCTVICMRVWRKREGAIFNTVGMWPIAPVTAKNICVTHNKRCEGGIWLENNVR